MSELVDLANTEEIPPGRAKAFDAGGRKIAVYHTADGFFATDNVCPHRGGPLADGDLSGSEITCPWHLWGFDVRTGACTGNAGIAVAAHPLTIDNGRILVSLT